MFFFLVGSVPAGGHAWRFWLGSSFRSAVICGAVAFCLVAFYFVLSIAFISSVYIITVYGLRSLCGRSMACGRCVICPEFMQIGALFPVLLLGSLSPLPSFLESGRNCSAVVIPSPAYRVNVGAVVLLWHCMRSFCGLLLGRC